ncbi:MAG: transglutaminase family protein, partial [Bacteroidetes bacterium]|nr:transglutaminase family protein [Bacteroidota bacterium]
MSIQVAIRHHTKYIYDKSVKLSPQVIRLRPAPHARSPIRGYSLKIEPEEHFINWQQDPFGNYQARIVVPERTSSFTIDVEVLVDMVTINPFDFFLEEYAEEFPFEYEPQLKKELMPYLEIKESGPLLMEWVEKAKALLPLRSVDFLVSINQQICEAINYSIRLEPGIQSSEETLQKAIGSCRDSAWLLVQLFRHVGLAARFVSGYLVQLKADEKPIDGPAGTEEDFTDLHAWAEVYLPGAGWVGLDATSGLFAGEGHIPLACT